MMKTLAARQHTEKIRVFYRRQISLLPLLGLVPSFLLATYSLMKPWASGRAFVFFKITRSPGAALLLAVTLAGMVGASVAVATRGRDRYPAAAVHLVTGVLMALVALLAFRMVREAPTRLLGVVPVASIRPGPGLRLFLISSAMVVALGIVELVVGRLERRKRAAHAHVGASREATHGETPGSC